jgi:hypothetical protein
MDEPELKFIDGFTRKLRKKLANTPNDRNCIETVWGRGHVLREPSEDEAKIPAWLWSPPPETAGFFLAADFLAADFFRGFFCTCSIGNGRRAGGTVPNRYRRTRG